MEAKKLVRVYREERRKTECTCRIEGGKCSNGTVKIKWETRAEEEIGAGVTLSF